MYVLRYTVNTRPIVEAEYPSAELLSGCTLSQVFLCVGDGDGSHAINLLGSDCLWLVPGTIDGE
jgi:hypothetical protein